MSRKEEPSATAWAILGLLSFGHELTGYELKKWADGSLRFFYWSPAISQIYSELKRLESSEYVSSRIIGHDDLRNKRVYQITPLGTDALRDWVEDAPVDPPMLKHSPLLRLWLGHLAEPDRLREIVLRHREYAVAMADNAKEHVAGAHERQMPMPAAVLHWAEQLYRNEVASADEMLAEIDRMVAAGGAGPAAGGTRKGVRDPDRRR